MNGRIHFTPKQDGDIRLFTSLCYFEWWLLFHVISKVLTNIKCISSHSTLLCKCLVTISSYILSFHVSFISDLYISLMIHLTIQITPNWYLISTLSLSLSFFYFSSISMLVGKFRSFINLLWLLLHLIWIYHANSIYFFLHN